MKKLFSKKQLFEESEFLGTVKESEVIDQDYTRVYIQLVFEINSSLFKTELELSYNQADEFLEYGIKPKYFNDSIECIKVKPVRKTIIEYKEVD